MKSTKHGGLEHPDSLHGLPVILVLVYDEVKSPLRSIYVQHEVAKAGHEPLHRSHLYQLVVNLEVLPHLEFGLVPLHSEIPLLILF